MSCVEVDQASDSPRRHELEDAWREYRHALSQTDRDACLVHIYRLRRSIARDQSQQVDTAGSDSLSVGAGFYQEHA